MSRLWKCILSGVACALIGLCGWNLLVAQSTVGQPSQSAACTTPEHRQFDFWVGDWDVFDIDNPNTVVARTHVDLILGGCVLREDYQDMNGMSGQSFSIYDATHKTWHQSWVTNRGQLLLLDGQMEGRQMRLHATDRTQDGKERQVRGSWEAVPGGVRETAVRSVDDGKTWQPWFDLMFRPHKP